MRFSPILVRRAADEAAAQVAEAIRIGDLQPGERLPSERDLAAQLEISRPTVREALRILAGEGIVEVLPGSGGGATIVTDLIPRRLLGYHPGLSESEVTGVLEARRLLEPRVAQLAAVNGEDAEYQAMAQTIQRQQRLVSPRLRRKDEELFLQLDLQFHLLIARASRNNTVVQLTNTLIRDLELARNIAMREPSTPEWVIDIHGRTLAAIRTRNLDLVDSVMDEHLSVLERSWEQVSGRPIAKPTPDFLKPMLRATVL
jgi:GntR family transcriptional repressor for pyruvate dehydrogenase complex